MTPFGAMPFAVLFERQDDGSLYSRSSLNSQTYIDLRFAKDKEGRWVLTEEAAMEGMGSQSYSLMPAGGNGSTHRWTYEERPGFLTIDVGLEDETLLMAVTLRGEKHVRFCAGPVAGRRGRCPAAGDAESGHNATGRGQLDSRCGGGLPDRIRQQGHFDRPLRTQSAKHGKHWLNHRKMPTRTSRWPKLWEPRSTAIRPTVRSTPARCTGRSTRPSSWIHGWPRPIIGSWDTSLNAPPIAGGSLVMAEETARKLAEFDAEDAAPLLKEIASRKAESE